LEREGGSWEYGPSHSLFGNLRIFLLPRDNLLAYVRNPAGIAGPPYFLNRRQDAASARAACIAFAYRYYTCFTRVATFGVPGILEVCTTDIHDLSFVYNGPALSSVGRVAFLFCLIPAISMGLQKQKVSPVNGCSAEGVEMACLRSEGHDKLRMGG